jgi:hypothetical protein
MNVTPQLNLHEDEEYICEYQKKKKKERELDERN